VTSLRPEAPPPRSAFRHLIETDVRFSDCDMNGHVNNAVYVTYFEYGRTLFIARPDFEVFDAANEVILARIVCDYRRELKWPNRIAIGSAVTRIGTTSMDVAHAVFDGSVCVATGQAVLVRIARATRKGTPWTDAGRAAFEGYRLGDAA
jgi:acyl-CoA thioester hydrolase